MDIILVIMHFQLLPLISPMVHTLKASSLMWINLPPRISSKYLFIKLAAFGDCAGA